MVQLLQTLTFLVRPDTYAFFKEKLTAIQLIALVQPLLSWMMGCLNAEAPGVSSLDALNMYYHITGVRRRIRRDIVLVTP